jgi:hypothetical protein
MASDPNFRAEVQANLRLARQVNPSVTEEQLLQRMAQQALSTREARRVQTLVRTGHGMLRQMGQTRRAEFRRDEGELFGLAIDAAIAGRTTEAGNYREAAQIYHSLSRSSVTVGRERAVVMEACRDFAAERITRERLVGILRVQHMRAELE